MSDGKNFPGAKLDYGIGESFGFLAGMRDIENRNRCHVSDSLEIVEKLKTPRFVKTCKRLVHDQKRFCGENRAAERDALTFAA